MKKEIGAGTILIAKPFMEDKRFEKAIILIAEHNTNGTIGFMINRKNTININELIPEINPLQTTIREGGPVEKETLFFIHKSPELIKKSEKIRGDFFWSGDVTHLIKGLKEDKIYGNEIIFLNGYAGWDKHQLETEIEEGSWIIHEMNLQRLYTKIEWSSILIEVNKEFEVWASAPSDFHLN